MMEHLRTSPDRETLETNIGLMRIHPAPSNLPNVELNFSVSAEDRCVTEPA